MTTVGRCEARHVKLVLCEACRDGLEREVRVGFRMEGTHVCLWPIHSDVWQKKKKKKNQNILN